MTSYYRYVILRSMYLIIISVDTTGNMYVVSFDCGTAGEKRISNFHTQYNMHPNRTPYFNDFNDNNLPRLMHFKRVFIDRLKR